MNGSKYITELIAKAVADGTRTATVIGDFEITEAIRIPSDFTLILEDCHLTLAERKLRHRDRTYKSRCRP